MLYLYKNYKNEDGSWNDTYIWSNYRDRNFIHGSMRIDVTNERLYTKLFLL